MARPRASRFQVLVLATFLLLSSQCRVPGAVDGSFCDLVALLEPGDRGGLPRVQNLVLVLGGEPMRATDRLAGAGAVAFGRGDAVGDALGDQRPLVLGDGAEDG